MDVDDLVSLLEADGDDAAAADVSILRESGALDPALSGRGHDVAIRSEIADGKNGDRVLSQAQ